MSDAVSQLRAAGIPPERIEEYRAAFALFDTERTGVITQDKLAGVLNNNFGRAYSSDDLQYMLKQFSDNGVVDFVSFAKALHTKLGDPRYNEAFADAFDLFDSGNTGELSKDDLIRAMMHLGEKLTDAEAEEMLKIAKKKDDFVRAMTNALSGGAPVPAGAAGGMPTAGAAAPGPGAPVPAPTGPPGPGPARPAGGPPGPGAPMARPGAPPAVPGPRPAGGPPRPGPPGPGAPGPSPSVPRPGVPRPPGA